MALLVEFPDVGSSWPRGLKISVFYVQRPNVKLMSNSSAVVSILFTHDISLVAVLGFQCSVSVDAVGPTAPTTPWLFSLPFVCFLD